MLISFILTEIIVDPSSTVSILWWAVTGLIGIVGILSGVIYRTVTKRIEDLEASNKAKDEELKESFEYIKDVNIDNIKTLTEFSGFIKTLTSNSERNNGDVRSDIKDIKEILKK